MTRYLTFAQVLSIHRESMRREGQPAVIIAPEKLEAALARPQASAFGEDMFPTLAEKAAALLQGIAIAHPFLDGNKRAAAAGMIVFLAQNGVRYVADQDALGDLTLAVAAGEMREVEEIAGRIRELFGLE